MERVARIRRYPFILQIVLSDEFPFTEEMEKMQLEWLAVFLMSIGIIVLIAFIVVFVIIGLCLGVALGPVKGENRELGSTFVTAFYIALTYLILLIPILGFFLFCIAIILQWYIIKSRHEVGWGGAIVAWIITIILIAIVIFIIAFVTGLALLSLIPIPLP